MSAVEVVGDADTVLAFALGGVPGQIVEDAGAARAAVAAVVQRVHQGGGPVRQPILLLVTRGIAEMMRSEIDRVILDARGPLVLEIPGFHDPLGLGPAAGVLSAGSLGSLPAAKSGGLAESAGSTAQRMAGLPQ